MCLLQNCICVSRPCEILGDVNAEELKAVYPLHRCLVDGDGCVCSALSPVIHHQLLGLVDVELEVVLLTASWKAHALSTAWYTIRTHSFADVHPFEGSGYIRDRKGEWTHLFCSSRGSPLCVGSVVSLETSIKSVGLVW